MAVTRRREGAPDRGPLSAAASDVDRDALSPRPRLPLGGCLDVEKDKRGARACQGAKNSMPEIIRIGGLELRFLQS